MQSNAATVRVGNLDFPSLCYCAACLQQYLQQVDETIAALTKSYSCTYKPPAATATANAYDMKFPANYVLNHESLPGQCQPMQRFKTQGKYPRT